jgi:hypothetical protein
VGKWNEKWNVMARNRCYYIGSNERAEGWSWQTNDCGKRPQKCITLDIIRQKRKKKNVAACCIYYSKSRYGN